MKFKTRIIVTFLTIILLPLVLASTAFLCIGGYLSKGQEEFGLHSNDYNVWIDPTQASRAISDEIFFEVKGLLDSDSETLEDVEVLNSMNDTISGKSSYILVRKGENLYYVGNEVAANLIFDRLPDFQEENVRQELDQSFYYDDIKKMVRQMDFRFSDEDEIFHLFKLNGLFFS